MSYKKPLAECNFGTPAAFGETATGSLPPEVGVVDGAQVYDRDGIDNSYVVEADDPAQQKALAERAAVELIDAINAVLDQASERYPHFENERGQFNLKRARNAITDFLSEW